MPLDAFAQLEFPGGGVQRFPANGQAGLELVPLVFDQQVPEVQGHRAVAGVVVQLRVQGRQRVGETDRQVVGGRGGRGAEDGGGQGRKNQAFHVRGPW
ncbi:hypothetical protein D3C73_1410080 [compost metagenome]